MDSLQSVSFQQFTRDNPELVLDFYSRIGAAVKPLQTNGKSFVAFHGTTAEGAQGILEEGIKLNLDFKNSAGDFGPAAYFTPSNKTPAIYGRKRVRAEICLKNPAITSPNEWEAVLNHMVTSLSSIFLEKGDYKRIKDIPVIFRQLLAEYFKEKGIDGIFCQNVARLTDRKMSPIQQKQWAIFNPESIQVKGVENCLLQHLKFRFSGVQNAIKHFSEIFKAIKG